MRNSTKPTEAIQADRLAFGVRETCELLGGISRVTLWRMTRRKLLTPIPGIRARLYARAELERFVAGKNQTAAT